MWIPFLKVHRVRRINVYNKNILLGLLKKIFEPIDRRGGVEEIMDIVVGLPPCVISYYITL